MNPPPPWTPSGARRVMELLRKIARENQTAVITVTHDVRMIEGFDYVYHLKDGHLNHQVS